MTEWAFPVAAWLLVFFVLVPATTLAALACHRFVLQKWAPVASVQDATGLGLLLLTPVALPLLWTLSGVWRQSSRASGDNGCIVHLDNDEVCLDPWMLATWLLATLGTSMLVLWRKQPRLHTCADDPSFLARLVQIVNLYPELASQRSRITLVHDAPFALATVGLWRPIIAVDREWAALQSNDELAAGLLHESGHVGAGDPWWQVAIAAAMRLNRLSYLLVPEKQTFGLQREMQCDRWAIAHGAQPLALAQAIVSAARFGVHACQPSPATLFLGSPQLALLQTRVQNLLQPTHAVRSPRPALSAILLAVTVAAVAQPWLAGTLLLDRLHYAVESFLLP